MRRTAAISAAALLALAGAACGSGSAPSKSAFATEFSAQKEQLGLLSADVAAAVRAARRKTDAALAAEFRALARRATTLAGSLGQLGAPRPYRGDLASLQSSVTQVAGTLTSIGAAATAHDANAARAGGESIVAAEAQVQNYVEVLSGRLGLAPRPAA